MSDGWLKTVIHEIKDDIKETRNDMKGLNEKFGDFMQDRRRTCPTAKELEKSEKIKAQQRVLRWTVIGIAVALLVGVPAWLSFLGKG